MSHFFFFFFLLLTFIQEKDIIFHKSYTSFCSRPLEPFGSRPLEPFGSRPLEPFGSRPLEPFGSRPLEPYSILLVSHLAFRLFRIRTYFMLILLFQFC
jgi:hypothetical protein